MHFTQKEVKNEEKKIHSFLEENAGPYNYKNIVKDMLKLYFYMQVSFIFRIQYIEKL